MITTEEAFFNFWKNEAIAIEDGEEVCDECNGDGIIGIFTDRPQTMNPKNMCNKCWGEGKLDWIEKITGKPCPFSSTTSSGGPSSASMSSFSVMQRKEKGMKIVRRANARLINKRKNKMSQVRRGRYPWRLPRSNL